MNDETTTTQGVLNYLQQHLVDVEVYGSERLPEDIGIKFAIRSAEGEFDLRVLDEAVESLDVLEISAMLEECDTIQVMRDLVEFPVTVTTNGCIF